MWLARPGATFYDVIPHKTMVLIFSAAAGFAALILLIGLRRFWRESGEGMH